ncbi:ABC transporter permease [Kurthia sibirica]|uniref:Diguanylate cyclase n=1 Tax=Kurthia sibirica TaxID=202750 RepID=A0A2U3ALN0_9BACL|nr:ABC transporter permease [Kurthia sibirica]PWI25434.1 diguanylate cyclase [Kurthia sibirica]GEK34331.1 glutathione ABC transporter permease GsiD [Kurthia sibirica]
MRFNLVFRRFMGEKIAVISAIYLLFILFCALFGNGLLPFAPNTSDFDHILSAPSATHWLGTDELGRDIVSRLVAGSSAALQAGIISILIPLFIGVPLGILAGYTGGAVDEILMRIVEAILAIPAILLALGITAALGVSLWNAMIAIGIVFTPQFARLARGQTLLIRREPYVESAKISNAHFIWIMRKHIMPNIAPVIIVQASFNLSFAIIVEASLSFLGLGAQDPQISWGNMLRHAYSMIEVNRIFIFYPGIAIMLTVLAGNFLGDGLRIALDPKIKSR